jgi:hypothetical protein
MQEMSWVSCTWFHDAIFAFVIFHRTASTVFDVFDTGEHQYLFSMGTADGGMKTTADVDKDYAPASDANPGCRLSVAPDGTRAIYAIATLKSGIRRFEGFKP